MSDETLPEPLTPPDCDLRGMPYMPVDLVRLFDSDLYALSTGEEFKAALTLWGKAFLQVPAGSVPNDDRILAHLSGAGARWPKVKAMALRGFVLCSDGRLYHPVVAGKARDAWEARLAQRTRTEAARAARAARRSDSPAAPPVTTPATTPATGNATPSVASSVTENVTGSKGELRERERDIRDTSSLRSEGGPSPAERPPPDAKAILWTEGLSRLKRITGKGDGAARGLLGRLCRDAHDDCALVSSLLHQAEADRIGDPIPWLTKAIQVRIGAAPSKPSHKPMFPDFMFEDGRAPAADFIDSTAEVVQ